MPPFVGQLRINFITDHQEVFFHADAGQGVEVPPRKHRSGGVRRKIEQQHLGPFGGTRHLRRIQTESVFRASVNGASLGMGQRNRRSVGHIARLVIDHRLPRI